MIVCPACHAENPDGTKICVKCGTELPKPQGAKAKAAQEPEKNNYKTKDLMRDLVELLWLFLIILLVCGGFYGELTHWTWRMTEKEEVRIVPVSNPSETTVAAIPRHVRRYAAPGPKTGAPEGTVEAPLASEQPPVELGSPDSFYKKGKVQYDAQHYQQSYESLKKALEIDPTYGKAYFALGYLYARFDMEDAAVRMYKMSLRFDPNNAQAMNNLGMRLKKEGNYPEAMPLFQKAVELEAQNADYRYDLGDAYLDQEQYPEAAQELQRAAELRPNDATIYDDLAISLERMGKKTEALDAWQKVGQYSKDPALTQNAQVHIDFLQGQPG